MTHAGGGGPESFTDAIASLISDTSDALNGCVRSEYLHACAVSEECGEKKHAKQNAQ